MNDITVTVPDTKMVQLKEKAARLGISLTDLVLLSIEEMLSQPNEEFSKTAEYVLQKNADLYRRLA